VATVSRVVPSGCRLLSCKSGGSFATMFCGVGLQNAAFQRIVVVPSQYVGIV
jgi:hypothetical protein